MKGYAAYTYGTSVVLCVWCCKALRAIRLAVLVLMLTASVAGVQVTGELLSGEGRVLARSTRTWVSRPKPLITRAIHNMISMPWIILGLYDDSIKVSLQLFERFVDEAHSPPVYFR